MAVTAAVSVAISVSTSVVVPSAITVTVSTAVPDDVSTAVTVTVSTTVSTAVTVSVTTVAALVTWLAILVGGDPERVGTGVPELDAAVVTQANESMTWSRSLMSLRKSDKVKIWLGP